MIMSEKEKCSKGLLYNANHDKELNAERAACKALCDEYNRLPHGDEVARGELMRRVLDGAGVVFGNNVVAVGNPCRVIKNIFV